MPITASQFERNPESFQNALHTDEVSPTPEYADQLRAAELRVTRPRVAVLQAVNTHAHADTETIFLATRTMLPDVSRQAVYDVLGALTDAGPVSYTHLTLPTNREV